MKLTWIPVYLSKEEDDARIERLTRKILRAFACLENREDFTESDSNSEIPKDVEDDLFGDIEKTLKIQIR